MNLKNLLTMLAGVFEGLNAIFPHVPPAICTAVGVILRGLVDQFLPSQSNVPSA